MTASTLKQGEKTKHKAAVAVSMADKQERERERERELEDELPEEDRRNLDAGYAWLILLIMFLLQSSISGASRVYGIVFAKQVAIDYYDREQASTPIATASAVENLAGVLTPALGQRLSWRKIELLGTLLFIGANLLAYASDSLWLDILSLGVVQGLALSISTVLSLAINNDYFEKYRTTAFGISMSGSTFGVLYLSPLVTWLLHDSDDFRQVYLMLALVFCFNVVLVLFIKPRAETVKKNKKEKLEEKSTSINQTDLEQNQQQQHQVVEGRSSLARIGSRFERHDSIASISYRARSRRQSVLSRTMTVTAAPDEKDWAQGGSVRLAGAPKAPATCRLAHRQRPGLMQINAKHLMLGKSLSSGAELASDNKQPQNTYNTTSTVDSDLGSWPSSKKTSLASGDHQIFMTIDEKLVSRADNDPRQATNNNSLEESGGGGREPEPLKQRLSSVAFVCEPRGEDEALDGRPKKHEETTGMESQKQQQQLQQQSLQTTNNSGHVNKDKSNGEFSLEVALHLLRVPYLHCAWIMLALYYLIARIFIIILVDFATDHGLGLADATNLLNYWSVGELCGRVLLGSLIDLKWMSCKTCIGLTCSTISALIACMILVESYYVYATCSLLIAALISLEYMLINVLIVEYLGKSKVTSCYSIAAFISSLVLFARPSLIGLFRDRLGSYDGLLWLLSATCLAYALLFQLLEPILVRRWPPLGRQ